MGNGVVIKLDSKRRAQYLMKKARERAQRLIERRARKRPERNILLRAHAGGNVLALASRRGLQLGRKTLPRRRI